tara:strand:+ start:3366 stop:3641 length:276 start_codon:yes stop_codon:yes gene_type:complete
MLFLSSPAWGQVPCVNADEGKQELMKQGQLPTFVGLSKRGHLTQIWVDKISTGWTAIYILPQEIKLMCIVDSGTISSLLDLEQQKKAMAND